MKLKKWATPMLIVLVLAFFIYIVWKERARPSGTIDLVIARYKEPLDWLKKYARYPFRRIYIYNKSEDPPKCPIANVDCRIESLPNVGVCDHTYLYHIVKTYNDPDQADMTIFLPASAASSQMKQVKIEPILRWAKKGIPSISGYRAWDKPEDDRLGGPGFYLDEWKVSDAKNRDRNDFQLAKASPRPYGEWYKVYFPGERPKGISLLGMFAVSREMIRSNSKALYESLLETVRHDKYPEAAHYVERSWATLFKGISPEHFI